ncbi:DNA methyltransferase [Streptomyces sp. NBC_00006]|uniref:TRM11 family SAM-dependent methyltransferase n=1 Tax=unclassified Streptomyces TaxID=2593676 RepID=UPI002251B4B6|nr:MULTISPECIES: DNA methyltransferase [unclassified Streptomyces]MCX5535772.1 DNA methyltransferase [Streptomyces sp. NBC_00006]
MHASASVWTTAPTSAPAQRKGRYLPGSAAHPAKMLPRLAAHAIATYTSPGDLVLDPMCGIGTTLVEAIHLGRDAIGIEYEPRWAHLAGLNAASAAHEGGTGSGCAYLGDARHATHHIPSRLHRKVDLVLTSPPYGPSVHGQVRSTRESGERGVTKTDYRYSQDPANLAHVGLDRLLEAFTEILTECRHVLRPGGTVVITTRPWRERGELIDLPSAAMAAGQAAGLIPAERNIALLAGLRDGQLVARPSFFQMKNVRDARRQGIPQHLIAHEDVIVLRNGSGAGGLSTDTSHRDLGRTCPQRCRTPRKPAPAYGSRTCRLDGRHGSS